MSQIRNPTSISDATMRLELNNNNKIFLKDLRIYQKDSEFISSHSENNFNQGYNNRLVNIYKMNVQMPEFG
jgi:hypothetical protein